MFYLQFGNKLFLFLGCASQTLQFSLIFCDSSFERGICLLSVQIFVDDFLYVIDGCLRADPLEGILYNSTSLHLLIHLHLVVLAPHLLDHEVLPEFHLILVLVLIGGSFRNL